MDNMETRLPAQWSIDLGIDIVDPDGWRIDHTPWNYAITESEFRRRAAMSTVHDLNTTAPFRKGDSARYIGPDTDQTGRIGMISGRVYTVADDADSDNGAIKLHGVRGTWNAKNFEVAARASTVAPDPEPQYKVGVTVADIQVGHTVGSEPMRAFRRDDGWRTLHGSWDDRNVTSVRPLVVIDPAAARESLEMAEFDAETILSILLLLRIEE